MAKCFELNTIKSKIIFLSVASNLWIARNHYQICTVKSHYEWVTELDINFFGHLSCRTSNTSLLLVRKKSLVRELAKLALVGMSLTTGFPEYFIGCLNMKQPRKFKCLPSNKILFLLHFIFLLRYRMSLCSFLFWNYQAEFRQRYLESFPWFEWLLNCTMK